MESLLTNKPLLYSLLVSASAVLTLASGLLPDVTTQFQLVEFDADVRIACISCGLDWVMSDCSKRRSVLRFLLVEKFLCLYWWFLVIAKNNGIEYCSKIAAEVSAIIVAILQAKSTGNTCANPANSIGTNSTTAILTTRVLMFVVPQRSVAHDHCWCVGFVTCRPSSSVRLCVIADIKTRSLNMSHHIVLVCHHAMLCVRQVHLTVVVGNSDNSVSSSVHLCVSYGQRSLAYFVLYILTCLCARNFND